jgi:hypothetical protein
MAKNNIFYVLLIVLIIMWGCKNKPNVIKAKQKINVYKDYSGDQKDVIFVLNPGDECKILGEKIAKVYAYYEVSCPGKGRGWVELGNDYEVFSK